jgi:sulfatase-modifying factor enzyme 1
MTVWRTRSVVAGIASVALVSGCPTPPRNHERSRETIPGEAASSDPVRRDAQGARPDAAEVVPATAEVDSSPPEDAMSLHATTTEELLSLVWLPPTDAGTTGLRSILPFLISPAAGRFSQGNPAIARHAIGRRACLDGLRDIVLQTDDQKKTCRGMENMVPVYAGGNPSSAKACIDIFEFPNRACELPMVWGTPSGAEKICEVQGKRLCSQGEWNLACRGDPEGKVDSTYAYGESLDMTICNTNKPHAMGPDGQWLCNAQTAQVAWATCATETEPSGSFPRCRSRLGVFDQHGNVAEMMTRKGTDGVVYTQLKGSAFFYVDVARRPDEAQKPGERETYPDQCNYDPRWHVEALDGALHSNYHLGFRCCLSL